MKILFFLLSLFMSSAQAADAGVVSIAQTVTDAIKLAGTDKIMPLALMWIGAFVLIQFTITNIGLLKSGADLEAVWAKFLGSLFWFGFCIYLLNNGPDFIDAVGGGILERFAGFPKPGWIITATLLLCTPFIAAIAAVGVVNTTLAIILMTAMLTVLSVGMMLALKIMMLTIELGLVVMLSPLSFSLLGLNALKDQGIAPLKSLLSLIYRTILLSVICIAFTEVISVSEQNLKNIKNIHQ
jgi:type IV secretion system protein TrbL